MNFAHEMSSNRLNLWIYVWFILLILSRVHRIRYFKAVNEWLWQWPLFLYNKIKPFVEPDVAVMDTALWKVLLFLYHRINRVEKLRIMNLFVLKASLVQNASPSLSLHCLSLENQTKWMMIQISSAVFHRVNLMFMEEFMSLAAQEGNVLAYGSLCCLNWVVSAVLFSSQLTSDAEESCCGDDTSLKRPEDTATVSSLHSSPTVSPQGSPRKGTTRQTQINTSRSLYSAQYFVIHLLRTEAVVNCIWYIDIEGLYIFNRIKP